MTKGNHPLNRDRVEILNERDARLEPDVKVVIGYKLTTIGGPSNRIDASLGLLHKSYHAIQAAEAEALKDAPSGEDSR